MPTTVNPAEMSWDEQKGTPTYCSHLLLTAPSPRAILTP